MQRYICIPQCTLEIGSEMQHEWEAVTVPPSQWLCWWHTMQGMSEHWQIELNNSFSLHWTDSLSPTALGKQSIVWTLGCAQLTTAHVKRSGAYTVHRCHLCTQGYCTHSPGVTMGCHLAYTEGHKAIHMTLVHCVHNSTSSSSCVHTYCTQMPLQCALS